MLDINFIRDNKEVIAEAARKKKLDFQVEELLTLDEQRRTLQGEVDELRAAQNQASSEISQVGGEEEKQRLITRSQTAKQKLQQKEAELKQVMEKWQQLMIRVPNIPDMSVPAGESEADNQEEKRVGEPPAFDFPPRDHTQLMTELDMVDFERGAKIHGFRGYVLKNDGALLSQAVWNYARDFFLQRDFEFFMPPIITKKEYFYGTGHLPSDAEDLYMTQDEDYLAGTAEVPMMAYHAGETLAAEELPKRYLAFSPCYRREAGSYGKDVKGLLRVHEFFKLEQLILCQADHELSVQYHEELNRNTEEFLASLELPYRLLNLCAGDLKAGHVKCYDQELWIPSQNTYREIGSASYYHDFQARRFNIRYRDTANASGSGSQKRYVHSLNATAIPTPRLLIALVENNQQSDGSVAIPPVLQPYLNGRESFHRAG